MLKKSIQALMRSQFGFKLFLKLADPLFAENPAPPKTRFKHFYSFWIKKGLINHGIIPFQLSLQWPYWVRRQCDPISSHFSTASFPLICLNTSHRNWTTLGFPGQDEGVVIDSHGLLMPFFDSGSLDYWIKCQDTFFFPGEANDILQNFSFDPPSVKSFFKKEGLFESSSEVFLFPLEPKMAMKTVTLRNTGTESKSYSLYIAVRPYNPEGISFIHHIRYTPEQAFIVNNTFSVLLDKKPHNIVCWNNQDAGYMEQGASWEMILQSRCSKGLASGFAEYRFTLQPNEEAAVTVKIPLNRLKISSEEKGRSSIQRYTEILYSEALKHTQKEWEPRLNPFPSIQLPDSRIQKLWDQNKVHLLSFLGNNKLFAGGFTERFFWMREAAHIGLALNRMGMADPLKAVLPYLPGSGLWKSRYALEGEKDFFGQRIWLIYDTYRFSQDKTILEKHYPHSVSLVKKIQKNCQKKLKDHDSNRFYMLEQIWALSGLESAQEMAKILGKEPRRLEFQRLAVQVAEDLYTLLARWSETVSIKEAKGLPLPRGFDASLIHIVNTLYPHKLLKETDPLLENCFRLIEKYSLKKGIFFDPLDFMGFSPVYNCQLAQAYLLKQNPKAFDLLNWLVQHASDTGCWPTAIHPVSGGGCFGDGHSAWASAEFIMLIRNMLVYEDNGVLSLTPFIPKTWLEPHSCISVKRMPTVFGPIDFTLKKQESRIRLTLETEFHSVPRSIQISFPYLIKTLRWENQLEAIHNSTAALPLTGKDFEFELDTSASPLSQVTLSCTTNAQS